MSENRDTETISCYLEREREIWLVAKARDDRAGHNNSEAILDRQGSMDRLDTYLEELFVAIGSVALPVENLGITR